MDTLHTFWDNITHYKTESVHFLGLMNPATKFQGPPRKAQEYASEDPSGLFAGKRLVLLGFEVLGFFRVFRVPIKEYIGTIRDL